MPLHSRLYKVASTVLLLSVLAVVACAADFRYFVYVGTYTDKGSKGIYAYRFDPSSGELGDIGLVATTDNPSFLAVATDDKSLYALNEINNFNGGQTGAVTTFSIDRSSG